MTNHIKFKHRRRPIADINVVPYLDVLLVLLIILMATAPLLTQGIPLQLPQVTAHTLDTEQTSPLIIFVDVTGQYYLDHHGQASASAISPEALTQAITKQLTTQQDQNQPIWIKADQSVTYEKIVALMALLQQAGVHQIGLVTEAAAKA